MSTSFRVAECKGKSSIVNKCRECPFLDPEIDAYSHECKIGGGIRKKLRSPRHFPISSDLDIVQDFCKLPLAQNKSL